VERRSNVRGPSIAAQLAAAFASAAAVFALSVAENALSDAPWS